jgi:hypothetical protein
MRCAMKENTTTSNAPDASSESKLKERMFTRIPIHSLAIILIDDEVIEGFVETISLNGAFVSLEKTIPIDSSVMITICDSKRVNTFLESKATVVSVTSDGVGLKFEKTSLA